MDVTGTFGIIGHSGHDLPASHIEIRWENGRGRRRDIPRGIVSFGGCTCGCVPGSFRVVPGDASVRTKKADRKVKFDVEGDIPHRGPAFCIAIVKAAEKAVGCRLNVRRWWMTSTRKSFRAVVEEG